MRLLQTNPNWQVQSLGREDISAPIRVAEAEGRASIAKGNAIKGLADTVAGISMDIYQRDENEKVGDYYATSIKSMQDTKAFLNRETIPVGEIPEGVNYEKSAPVSMPDGSIVMQERTAIPTHEISEQIFQRSVDSIHKVGKETLSKRGYEAFYGKFTPTELSNRGSILNYNAKAKYDQQRQRALQGAESLFFSGNAQAGKDIINNSEVFTVQEKQDAIEGLEIKTEIRTAETLMESGNPVDMRKQADALISQDYKGVLDLDQRNALAKQLVTRADTLQAEMIARQEQARARAVSDYEILIDKGGGSPQEITMMAEKNMITWKDRTRMTKAWYDKQGSMKSDAEDISRVLYSIETGVPMSPSLKEDRDAVNNYVKAKLAEGDFGAIVEATKGSTILSDVLQGYLDIGARHPNSEEVAKAVNLYSRLREEIPGFAAQVPSETREILNSISILTENGLPPELARERVMQASQMTEDELKAKRAQYYSDYDMDKFQRELQNMADDDPRFGGENELWSWAWADDVQPMMAAYDELRWRYYLSTGSHEAAKNAAYRDLSSVWGSTKVNAATNENTLKIEGGGSQLAHHTVETTYNTFNDEEIEQAIQNFADSRDLVRDRMLIVSDGITTSARPENRTWAIKLLDPYGLPMGTFPERLKLDFTEIKAKREAKAAKEETEKLQAAEEERQNLPVDIRQMPARIDYMLEQERKRRAGEMQ